MQNQQVQSIIDTALTEYDALVAQADSLFDKVQKQCPDEVRCHEGCISCCHAPFDVGLIEALALQKAFKETFDFGGIRSAVVTAAAEAERELTKQKKYYHQLTQQGYTQAYILDQAAKFQLRCPLLGVEDSCLMYANRPITCRLYGIPTLIDAKSHVCGQSGFERHLAYPTVNLGSIQDKLASLSHDLQKALNSKFDELYLVYIPLATVILHPLDKEWLGVK